MSIALAAARRLQRFGPPKAKPEPGHWAKARPEPGSRPARFCRSRSAFKSLFLFQGSRALHFRFRKPSAAAVTPALLNLVSLAQKYLGNGSILRPRRVFHHVR